MIVIPTTVTLSGRTSDFSYPALIPAGYTLSTITVYNSLEKSDDNAAQLSAGTTAGGSEIFAKVSFPGSSLLTITINNTFSLISDTTFYLHHAGAGDAWNGARLTLYVVLIKLI